LEREEQKSFRLWVVTIMGLGCTISMLNGAMLTLGGHI
jgi:hypothetical protein